MSESSSRTILTRREALLLSKIFCRLRLGPRWTLGIPAETRKCASPYSFAIARGRWRYALPYKLLTESHQHPLSIIYKYLHLLSKRVRCDHFP